MEVNTSPLKWRMARIQKLYPGTDKTARVADLFTSRGVIRRAVHNLCPLEASTATARRSNDFEKGGKMLRPIYQIINLPSINYTQH
ncbi:unnamed protein product [Arctia plantaginis]|uniref:DUF5641 domain-containing protein n=1 Tax=Arctia plantaginis TaxID=874455 RepID=A0A8S1AGW4_ARCPL|nr:unnamed protein product [Arctia plantaginis]